MEKVKVSIIIPCYNQGKFIDEAVDSVLAQSYKEFEIIIVNDGSTDELTSTVLRTYNKDKTRVIHTENQGLAAARNNGIKEAKGDYILPLDADDTIGLTYLEQAVYLLDNRSDLGIVYCRAQLFGAVETEWLLPRYSLEEILIDNVIFCSAMFRKSDWESVGGYDPGMIYGWEDYEFWLSLIELGREVYQIPEILFSYRVTSDSMVRSKERWQKVAMFKRIFKRHEKLFSENIEVWINSLLEIREPYYTSKLYVDTGNGLSDTECISRKVEKGTAEINFSLEDYQQIEAIRFDPIDAPAIIEFFNITVTDKQGKSMELTDFTDNSIFHLRNQYYFDSDDSQCFPALSPAKLNNMDFLTIKLSYQALAGEALQEIVKLQQERLQDMSSHLMEYKSAGILQAVKKSLRKKNKENNLHYIKRQLKLL